MSGKQNRRKQQAGFSLVELLIVITIIGILIAVLVPSALKMLKSGRENGAISNLRTIYSAEVLYHSKHGKYASLKELVDDKYLTDSTYAGGKPIKGYIYTSTEADGTQFCVQATREAAGSGDKDFNVIEDSVIRYTEAKSPNPLPYNEGTPLSKDK